MLTLIAQHTVDAISTPPLRVDMRRVEELKGADVGTLRDDLLLIRIVSEWCPTHLGDFRADNYAIISTVPHIVLGSSHVVSKRYNINKVTR